ncbi:MAG: type II toxin-antitoxin system VapC family toxin [Mycobacteriales bacterium]
MIVLDTTVLVYALGSEHPLRTPCRRLIDAVAEGSLRATTTVEVVQELAHVRARRRDRADAAQLAQQFVDLLAPLLPVDETALRSGLALYAGSTRLGAFDAVLAAATLAAGAEALVSADAAFAEVPGLTHVPPTEDGVGQLLAG